MTTATAQQLLTTTIAAKRFDVEPWQVRLALDGLGAASIPRVGRMRAIPPDLLPRLKAELVRRGWIEEK